MNSWRTIVHGWYRNRMERTDTTLTRIATPAVEHGGRTITYCTRCVTPNTRPRVTFDAEGVCNACRVAEGKPRINWDERRKEFLTLLDRYRRTDGGWDCIIPWSGGKDSSMIAYRMKFEFGMNPLLVTFSPMIINEVGEYNREALRRLGFDSLFIRPNQKIQRHLARRFFIERGNPKVAWEAGKEATPMQVAVRYRIPLVFYAEHGESEYGGKVLSEESKRTKDFTEVVEHLVGDDARNWVDDVVTEFDLNPYRYPDAEDIRAVSVRAYYFAYFFRWSMYENYEFVRSKVDFRTASKGRTDGTFTNFDSLDDKMDNLYYYLQYVKFGFGRAARDASRMIQNGHLTRDQGLQLVRKHDHEFPSEWFDAVLEYLSITRAELHRVIDQHRNPEIWYREGTEWRLRYPQR